ncbi:hypothetical protein AB0E85_25985 [Streptomyces sp. NPDC029044]|uniref:hypothetical protein n=1 Tax=Streptomyces sp. NPDC029044 TaxID=3157198 RepID=UPI00340681F6
MCVAGPNGDGDFHAGDPANQAPCLPWPGENVCASLESFHPKNAGTAGYARVMEQALTGIGYKGGYWDLTQPAVRWSRGGRTAS